MPPRSFTESMSSLCPGKPWQTKLSSAGLVYLHFGHKLLAQLLGADEEDSVVGVLYDKVGVGDHQTPAGGTLPALRPGLWGRAGLPSSTLAWLREQKKLTVRVCKTRKPHFLGLSSLA